MKWVLIAILIIALLAIVVPSLWRAVSTPGVQGGLGEIRTLMSAEDRYASANGGYFDSPSCLAAPDSCLPEGASRLQPFLDRDVAALRPSTGYTFRFAAGPPAVPGETRRSAVSRTSLTAFAVVALPLAGSGQRRAFCGDSTGRICARGDGTMPGVGNGRCPEGCDTLR